eukprot:c22010_g2_i6.p1 GENE.c22010_g2_i6~~c22010_g2_i6.p1  ORF type:complete len:590 (+),score=152.24 c22010_g2_i6:102-1871(+)
MLEKEVADLREELQLKLELNTPKDDFGLHSILKEDEKNIISEFKIRTIQSTEERERELQIYEKNVEIIAKKLSTNHFKLLDVIFRHLWTHEIKVVQTKDYLMDFSCCIQQCLLPGRLYIKRSMCTFFGHTWNGVLTKSIFYDELKLVERSDILGLIPDSIYLLTENEELQLDNFYSREKCFRVLRDYWLGSMGYNQHKIVREGYLMIKGGFLSSWKPHLLVLNKFCLACYDDSLESSATEVIPFYLVKDIRREIFAKYNCLVITSIGHDYIFGDENKEKVDEWYSDLQNIFLQNLGVFSINFNVCSRESNRTLSGFDTGILQLDLTTNMLKLYFDQTTSFSASFSSLINVKRSFYNSITVTSSSQPNLTPMEFYFGSERESSVMLRVLTAIVKDGESFRIPQELKRHLMPVKAGYAQRKIQGSFIFAGEWCELMPFGDMVFFSSASSLVPTRIVNMVGANIITNGARELHFFFPTDFHQEIIRFLTETDRDEWSCKFLEISRNVKNQLHPIKSFYKRGANLTNKEKQPKIIARTEKQEYEYDSEDNEETEEDGSDEESESDEENEIDDPSVVEQKHLQISRLLKFASEE